MELIGLNSMSLDELISDEMLGKVFAEEDPVDQARLLLTLEDRAAEFRGGRVKFKQIVNGFKKRKKSEAVRKQVSGQVEGWTAFELPEGSGYQNMRCGTWMADATGVWLPIDHPPYRASACPHPILPVERLINLETGDEKLKLIYQRNGRWSERVVGKSIVASASKILCLADAGVMVNSENAKGLVRYLGEVESLNEGDIKIQRSTTKLGWHGDDFLPYDSADVIFDGDAQFAHLMGSITQTGNYRLWLECVKKVRATGRIEPRMMLAASFASPLVEKLGILPFFVDLFGMTEGGKTVSLMLATSIWANPGENRYIGDFRTTDTALEIKADMLNNLPVMLDDTAKADKRISENFETVVYNLCSGRGKGRSNKELGISRMYGWNNVFISNGESPLNSYVSKGGAINRIIEVECGENVYSDPAEVAETLKRHFGWAGFKYINKIKSMPIEELKNIYNKFFTMLSDESKMAKQTASMACIMTADKIATDLLFHDGNYITLEEAKKLLIDRDQVSDGERCYQMIMDTIVMNSFHFDAEDKMHEQWGIIEDTAEGQVALFFPHALEKICKAEGYTKNSFIAWAYKNKLLVCDSADGKRKTKVKKVNGKSVRMIWMKVREDPEDQFQEAGDDDEIPFN